MARKNEPYSLVVVESFLPASTSGLHGDVHIRPVAGQGLDTDMFVECSKELSKNYRVGTRFRIKAKVTDREGSRPFLYSYFGWRYDVLSDK
jgi:hypothetical protein